jgi:hypothetical protein
MKRVPKTAKHPRTIAFLTVASFRLDDHQINAARDAINLRLFGDKHVNEEGPDGQLTGKPMSAELDKRLCDRHRDLERTKSVRVEATLDIETGRWSCTIRESDDGR